MEENSPNNSVRLSPEARARVVEGWKAMANIVANIAEHAEHQDDERLIELIWQMRGEFGGFLRTVVD